MRCRRCAGRRKQLAISRPRHSRLLPIRARTSTFSPPIPMRSTFRRMTRGWCMDIRSWHGRDGIRIPGSGLADRIFHSDSVLASAGLAVLDGDGVIGVSTGVTITSCSITAAISPGAERFTTAAIIIAAESDAEELTAAAAAHTGAGELRLVVFPVSGVESTAIPVPWPGLSTETGRQPEDTLNRAARAASVPVHSADTGTAVRPGAFPHADRRASAARVAAEAMAGVIELKWASDGSDLMRSCSW